MKNTTSTKLITPNANRARSLMSWLQPGAQFEGKAQSLTPNTFNTKPSGILNIIFGLLILFVLVDSKAQDQQEKSNGVIKQEAVVEVSLQSLKNIEGIDRLRLFTPIGESNMREGNQLNGQCVTNSTEDMEKIASGILESDIRVPTEDESRRYLPLRIGAIEFEAKDSSVISFQVKGKIPELHKVFGVVVLNGSRNAFFSANDSMLFALKQVYEKLEKHGSCTRYSTKGRQ